jgi:hypothetical protein
MRGVPDLVARPDLDGERAACRPRTCLAVRDRVIDTPARARCIRVVRGFRDHDDVNVDLRARNVLGV